MLLPAIIEDDIDESMREEAQISYHSKSPLGSSSITGKSYNYDKSQK
tara:strand:- start:2469 stop:2609 length:141 start_codon:yes stop_codon:yes gene_type:complete